MRASAGTAQYRAPAKPGHASLRLWLRLLACSSLVEREVRARLRAEFEVTLPQFDLLAQLAAAAGGDVRGLTMSELSRRLMVTNGNLTGLVERLVKEGLVTRAASPTDGRSHVIRLSPHGRRAFTAMAPLHEGWINEMFGALSREGREQLFGALGELRDSIRTSLSAEDVP